MVDRAVQNEEWGQVKYASHRWRKICKNDWVHTTQDTNSQDFVVNL